MSRLRTKSASEARTLASAATENLNWPLALAERRKPSGVAKPEGLRPAATFRSGSLFPDTFYVSHCAADKSRTLKTFNAHSCRRGMKDLRFNS